ncbi:MAG: lysophospholipid acyltransferase family protein [Nocardioidaceae bacterium]
MSSSDPHAQLPRTDDVAPLHYRLQAFLRPPGRRVLGLWWEVRQHNAELVPRTGPVLLASNHVGIMDGPLLIGFSPRPTHALIKSEMFRGQTSRFFTAMGQIPLHRFQTDRHAVDLALRALRDDQVVAIYPEGSRGDGEFAAIKPGAAYLALVSGAPIVPVATFGTRAPGRSVDWVPPRGARLDVVYGEPLRVTAIPWPRRRDVVAELTRRLQERLIAHVATAQQLTGAGLPGPAPDEEGREPGSISVLDEEHHGRTA